MNICCRESLEPSIKLSKMINLLKVIAFVYFVLIIADIFLFKTSLFFLLLFQLLLLLFTILKKDYGYFLFFILICLMYILQYLENVVKRFKYGINHGGELALAFCYSVLLFYFIVPFPYCVSLLRFVVPFQCSVPFAFAFFSDFPVYYTSRVRYNKRNPSKSQ